MANFKVEFTFVYFSQLLRQLIPKRGQSTSVLSDFFVYFITTMFIKTASSLSSYHFYVKMRKKIFYNVDYYLAKVRFQLTQTHGKNSPAVVELGMHVGESQSRSCVGEFTKRTPCYLVKCKSDDAFWEHHVVFPRFHWSDTFLWRQYQPLESPTIFFSTLLLFMAFVVNGG